ncbi:CtsR family transcriptional regulator [Peptococcaceae bacterium 1198_IL3148]
MISFSKEGDNKNMSSMSNIIEAYLKSLLNQSKKGLIEIQRNELASKFNCVPSQINYVLSTRFTIGHGYIVESRRGGGGYIRIEQVPLDNRFAWLEEFNQLVGDDTSQQVAGSVLKRLFDEEIITEREYNIMQAAIDRAVLKIELPWRDKLRANILKAMVSAVIKDNKNNY